MISRAAACAVWWRHSSGQQSTFPGQAPVLAVSGRRLRSAGLGRCKHWCKLTHLWPNAMKKNHRLHYAWIIVTLTFVVVVVTAGVRATPSVLIVPLEQEFHWSRATISLAVAINLLLYGAVGPFAAAVMDRFGTRRTMTLALAGSAAGVALTPMMSELWQLMALWG